MFLFVTRQDGTYESVIAFPLNSAPLYSPGFMNSYSQGQNRANQQKHFFYMYLWNIRLGAVQDTPRWCYLNASTIDLESDAFYTTCGAAV